MPARQISGPFPGRSRPVGAIVFHGSGESERMTTAEPLLAATPADAVLNALPHPVIVVSADGKVVDANVAAEAFFEVSAPLLRRHLLRDLVPFGSPLLSLVEQVRASGAAVNEYKVDLGTPRNPGDRAVDLHVAPLPERPDFVVVMLQERTHRRQDGPPAHASRRRALGDRARRHARARDQESAVRHSRRGAVARAVGRRRRPHADAADLRRGRPHREAGRSHGGVRRRAAGRARADQHPRRARPREAAGAIRRRPPHQIRRGLRSVAAAGAGEPRSARSGLSQSGEERGRGDRREQPAARSCCRPHSVRACGCRCRASRPASRCRSNSASGTTGRACPTN